MDKRTTKTENSRDTATWLNIFLLQTKTYMKITWEHRVFFFCVLPSFLRVGGIGYFFRGEIQKKKCNNSSNNNTKKQNHIGIINKFELCVVLYGVAFTCSHYSLFDKHEIHDH